MSTSQDALKALDESKVSRFQFKMVITAGMGFFTDAYDLFIIGVVSSILGKTWHISSLQTSLLSSVALLASALGAILFGIIADRLGRKFIYGYELLVLAAGAIASALSPNVVWLIIFRFVLGIGIGGDYPVSSTIMSEYSNQRDRGKLMTLVFSTQAIGLIIGPILVYLLLIAGVNLDLVWRVILGVGAIPALATFGLRRHIAESPRFAMAHGNQAEVDRGIAMATGQGQQNNQAVAGETKGNSLHPSDSVAVGSDESVKSKLNTTSWKTLFTTRHFLLWLIGAAGAWFLLDFSYYGTTVSTPIVIKLFSPKATLEETMLYTLLIFVVAALPGYIVAAFLIDRMGRKAMQLLGFAIMALSYASLFFFPAWTKITATFLIAYGLSYFFTEFGPNVTTFLYPAEIFPVLLRTTSHGISASLGKIGAFFGAFLFPVMLASTAFKLPGAMGVAAAVATLGFLFTLLLPEPNQKSLETIEREGEQLDKKIDTASQQASPGQRMAS